MGDILKCNFTIKEIKNPLLKSFLNDPSHAQLFEMYKYNPNHSNYKRLDVAFKEFHFKVIAISYLATSIYYEAKHFDRKIRMHNEQHKLILDESAKEGGENLKDIVGKLSTFSTTPRSLEESFHSIELQEVVSQLSDRQKDILFDLFVLGYNEKEIAKKLDVSQQAVSKSKQSAIKKMRNLLVSE